MIFSIPTISVFDKTDSDPAIYDMLIVSLGYENRSSHVGLELSANATVKLAAAFDRRHSASYEENRIRLSAAGFVIFESSDGEIKDLIASQIKAALVQKPKDLRIGIDISSMTRVRIANCLLGIASGVGADRVRVDFLYAPAEFREPTANNASADISEPVCVELSGWSDNPALPSALVVGLGYEPERAVGAAEFLDAARIWALSPRSSDQRYDRAVGESNRSLLDSTPRPKIVYYPVNDPFETYFIIDELVRGLIRGSRVTLLPFGPKILALCAMISAFNRYPSVTVWRVSGFADTADDSEIDCAAQGPIYSLRTEITVNQKILNSIMNPDSLNQL
nr:hypothetical protein [Rhodococcus sp. (in: high G+C Gram-positive bacteria)]